MTKSKNGESPLPNEPEKSISDQLSNQIEAAVYAQYLKEYENRPYDPRDQKIIDALMDKHIHAFLDEDIKRKMDEGFYD
jgi:hypothetical protein